MRHRQSDNVAVVAVVVVAVNAIAAVETTDFGRKISVETRVAKTVLIVRAS